LGEANGSFHAPRWGSPSDGESFESKTRASGPRYVSDTGELTWDTEQRSVMLDAKRSKALIGDGRGRTANLGGSK
jgi:hypothetical protein